MRTEDIESAATFLEENLFFTRADSKFDKEIDLLNGSCRVTLRSGPSPLGGKAVGEYEVGVEHIALGTDDIDQALQYARTRNLDLSPTNGQIRLNPGVYGDGERYFKIKSPFGWEFEIGRKVSDTRIAGGNILRDLDHVGIPCTDLDREVTFFAARGFVPEFVPVRNQNDADGRIRCVMLTYKCFTLEIYQFEDQIPRQTTHSDVPCALYGLEPSGVSPSGVILL